jgi:hypothetical protein
LFNFQFIFSFYVFKQQVALKIPLLIIHQTTPKKYGLKKNQPQVKAVEQNHEQSALKNHADHSLSIQPHFILINLFQKNQVFSRDLSFAFFLKLVYLFLKFFVHV